MKRIPKTARWLIYWFVTIASLIPGEPKGPGHDRRLKSWLKLTAVLLVISGLALLTPCARAQDLKYKVGDRVEFDTLETSNPEKAIWKKATIIEIKTAQMSASVSQTSYVVQLDPLPRQLPKTYTIPVRLAEGPPWSPAPWQTIGWLRPGEGTAPQIETDKLLVDDNGTVLADRELLDCKDLKQGTARNGPPPPAELAKKLIRCLYEKPSEPGMDGATKFDISEFSAGAPHRWIRGEDLGAGATINTMVYPFRVKWTQKSFYHTFNQVYTNSEAIFTCYVDVDNWYCGLAQTIKNGEKKLIQVKKE